MAFKLLAFFGTKQTLAWASRSPGAPHPGGLPLLRGTQARRAQWLAGLAAALALALGNGDLRVGRGRSRSLRCCQVSMETAGAIFSTLHPRLQRRSCSGFSLQDPKGGSRWVPPLGHLPEVKPVAVAAFLRGDITGTGPGRVSPPCSLRTIPRSAEMTLGNLSNCRIIQVDVALGRS